MSKTTKNTSSSTLSLNGDTKATVVKDGSGTYLNYYMNPYEKEAYDFAQKSFAENLPNVNIFSSEVIESLNKQVQAFQNKGIKSINEIYGPMLKELQNDIASRFGNLNNSVFMDKLNSIESKRADSVSTLAENIAAKYQELANQELANRYSYLDFLNSYQNQQLGDMYSALGLGGKSTSGSSGSLIDSNMAIKLLNMAASALKN